ncbi:MAG: slipin family protein [Gemmatimonadetes bacterium]|nr:slipin family protein [Gemmatimonadota bacterium]
MDVIQILGLAAAVYALSSLRIIKQYERGVSFFLGRYWNTKGPGLKFLPTFIAHMHRVSLRIVAMDIPPQDVITRDNVSVKVNAVLYMRVKDAATAIIQIENYLYATSQLAQTTLRSVLGEHQLDDLLAEREKINDFLKRIIDARTDDWGIEVTAVEVKDVDLPPEMKRAMARQAEAERERRAKIINAEGELQASQKLTQAAHIMGAEPVAIQLRYLQTVSEIASEKNSTTFFPLPIDLLRPFVQGLAQGGGNASPAAAQGAAEAQPRIPATGPRPSLSPPGTKPSLPGVTRDPDGVNVIDLREKRD